MNTDCSKCIFANKTDTLSNACAFNIPSLISTKHDVLLKDQYVYISDYKCSYAFSQNTYDQNKDNLPKDMSQFMREQNYIRYYYIIDCEHVSIDNIKNIFSEYINILMPTPIKVSIICQVDKQDLKDIIGFYQKNIKIQWKIHNMTISDASDENKLFDIINVNLSDTNDQLLYIKYNDLNKIQEDLNYINYLINVEKPKYAAIKKFPNSLEGLCISANNLKAIKFEHKHSGYLKFIKENDTIIRYYYE